MRDAHFEGIVGLRYNGHPRFPNSRGRISGVTPSEGLAPGESVAIDEQVLRRLRREPGTEEDFAVQLHGYYNANYQQERWTLVLFESPQELEEQEPEVQEVVQSDEDSMSAEADTVGGDDEFSDDEEPEEEEN